MLERIVSGGQTGADQAGWRAAGVRHEAVERDPGVECDRADGELTALEGRWLLRR